MKKFVLVALMIISNSCYCQSVDSTQLSNSLFNYYVHGTSLEFNPDSSDICGSYLNDTVSIWSTFFMESNDTINPEADYTFPQPGDTTNGDFYFCDTISKILFNAVYKRLNVTLDTIVYMHLDSSINSFFPTDSLTPEQLTSIDTSRASSLMKYYYKDSLEVEKLIMCYQYSSFNNGTNVVVLGDGKLSDEMILEQYMYAILQKFELQWGF